MCPVYVWAPRCMHVLLYLYGFQITFFFAPLWEGDSSPQCAVSQGAVSLLCVSEVAKQRPTPNLSYLLPMPNHLWW